MRKFIILLAITSLAIFSNSCEKEVESNYETLQGEWRSKNPELTLYFKTNEILEINRKDNSDDTFHKYEITENNELLLLNTNDTIIYRIHFDNKRKLRIYGIGLTYTDALSVNTYVEFKKVLL